MPAYLIVVVAIDDAEAYGEYVRRVPAVVAQYGGRYLVRGAPVIPLVGGWAPEHLIVVEFESLDA